MEQALTALPALVPRRYSVGGNVAWVAWPAQLPANRLEAILVASGLCAVPVTGQWHSSLLGKRGGQSFASRLLRAFDPQQKFQRLTPVPAEEHVAES